jgi:hypothetical protein
VCSGRKYSVNDGIVFEPLTLPSTEYSPQAIPLSLEAVLHHRRRESSKDPVRVHRAVMTRKSSYSHSPSPSPSPSPSELTTEILLRSPKDNVSSTLSTKREKEKELV